MAAPSREKPSVHVLDVWIPTGKNIDTSCSVGNVKYTSEKFPSLVCKPIWREEIWLLMGRKLLPPT